MPKGTKRNQFPMSLTMNQVQDAIHALSVGTFPPEAGEAVEMLTRKLRKVDEKLTTYNNKWREEREARMAQRQSSVIIDKYAGWVPKHLQAQGGAQ